MRKIAIVSPGSLPSSRQALITPRATMSTRVLETIDIITAIFSTPSFCEHLLGQPAGLGHRRVAADLRVVGRAAALGAHRVGERQRAAAGADHEPEVAVEAGVLALDHAAVVGGVDRRHGGLEGGRLVALAGALVLVDAELGAAPPSGAASPRSPSPCARRAPRSVPSSSCASGLISASVMSRSRNSRASRATIGVSRLSSLPVTPGVGDHLLGLEVGERQQVREVAAARRGRGAPRPPARCRSRPCR